MNQYDKFLKGEPLNEELAELASKTAIPEPNKTEFQNSEDTLSKADRERLRQLQQHPGWAIAMRLLDLSLESTKESAVKLSEHDPAGNIEGIKNAWIYIKAFKAVRAEIVNIIESAARAEGVEDETILAE